MMRVCESYFQSTGYRRSQAEDTGSPRQLGVVKVT